MMPGPPLCQADLLRSARDRHCRPAYLFELRHFFRSARRSRRHHRPSRSRPFVCRKGYFHPNAGRWTPDFLRRCFQRETPLDRGNARSFPKFSRPPALHQQLFLAGWYFFLGLPEPGPAAWFTFNCGNFPPIGSCSGNTGRNQITRLTVAYLQELN